MSIAKGTHGTPHPLERLAGNSAKCGVELEAQLFSQSSRLIPRTVGQFLVLTVDRKTEIYYAPITNIERDQLAQALGIASDSAIMDHIRNNFPLSFGATQMVSHLTALLGGQQLPPECFLLVRIDASGTASFPKVYGPSPLKSEIENYVQDALHQTSRIDPSINSKIQQFMPLFLTSSRSYLVLRTHPSLSDEGMLLAQIGLLSVPHQAQSDDAHVSALEISFNTDAEIGIAESVLQAMDISAFAALTLLYERERYYQKAIRQATRGAIIKFGDAKDIVWQRDKLRDLASGGACVPEVQDNAQSDGDSDGLSWYRMTRFALPSLADVLTSTTGLLEYEVIALVRAAIEHLRTAYWHDEYIAHEAAIGECFGFPLALAIEKADVAYRRISDCSRRIMEGLPVVLRRRLDMFDAAVLERYEGVISTVNRNAKFRINLQVPNHGESSQECAPAPRVFASILREVETLKGLSLPAARSYTCVCTDGGVHGDAHFANLLLDASIPEKPLVASIDPTELTHENGGIGYKKVTEKLCNNVQYERQAGLLRSDFSYDFAKLMLSCGIGYSLAYRRAFILRFQGEESQKSLISLAWATDRSAKLGETGGISGSQIVKIDAPVPNEAWDYHRVAVQLILESYKSTVRKALQHTRADEPSAIVSMNAAMIRLWLLTVRNGFSTVSTLFPIDIERAVLMYALSVRFLNAGHKHVISILKGIGSLHEAEYLRMFLAEGGIGRQVTRRAAKRE